MSRITLKEIREFAQSLPNDMKIWQKYDMLLQKLTEEECRELNRKHLVNTSDYKHMHYAELDFDENDKGILMATFYEYNEVEKFLNVAAKKLTEEFNGEAAMEYDEWWCNNYPAPVFSEEVPLTRGYSDTSKHTDTTFSSLDLEMALTEIMDESYDCHKVYPWMLREICNPSEFGITEEEFEMELEDFLC